MLKRFCIMFMILVVISLCPVIVSADGGVEYLGEICYLIDSGSHLFTKDYEVRLSVLYDGKGYYILNGRQFGENLHGTGIIEGNNFVISLTSTGADSTFPQAGSSTFSSSEHIVVDLSTLKGYRRIMGFRWKYDPNGDNSTMPNPYTHQDELELYVCN
ncbi:MAG: hypothetical protein A2Y66_08530 [Nitrospirae bacterium RBG_13_41_22]|nr:MAG: hypothetical protein A2Y66_08530 [Nitrospirae bacterium RBG_13_41_22]